MYEQAGKHSVLPNAVIQKLNASMLNFSKKTTALQVKATTIFRPYSLTGELERTLFFAPKNAKGLKNISLRRLEQCIMTLDG